MIYLCNKCESPAVTQNEKGIFLCRDCFESEWKPNLNIHHLVSIVCALIQSGADGTKEQLVQAAREILQEIDK